MDCPACGGERSSVFFTALSVPVTCNVLHRTRESALAAARGEVRLALCAGCGLVFNEAFDEGLLRYGGEYENALHFSGEFRRYAEDLARGLARRHALRGKRVVELGCGDGSFLSLLCREGGCEGVGYDPAHDPSRSAVEAGVNVRIERALYGPGATPPPPRADLVVCRHTLEHVARPLEFLREVRRAIVASGGASGAAVFFEVPNFAYTLEGGGIWDILYEHCNYFTRESLLALFERAGFTPIASGSVYGGQFLTVEARPSPEEPRPAPVDTRRIEEFAASFGRGFEEKVSFWRGTLRRLRDQGRTAALWGAGTKGVMFLNIMGEEGAAVERVVDVNPRKHGCYVAGAGQRIVAPADLVRDGGGPEVVIVMNPVYRREISEQLASMGARAEVMVA